LDQRIIVGFDDDPAGGELLTQGTVREDHSADLSQPTCSDARPPDTQPTLG
jgi:hypothetical protein